MGDALAEFIGWNEELSWVSQYPKDRGFGHLMITLTPKTGRAFSLDLMDDGELGHTWIRRGTLSLDVRDRADGSSPLHEPESAATLEQIKSTLTTPSEEDFENARSHVEKTLNALRAWGRLSAPERSDDAAFRQISWAQGQLYGILRLSFRCNQDCSFCWQSRDWPAPPISLYQTWLDEMVEAGVKFVIFSGGEPTLIKELPDLVERAHRKFGLRTQIQTNAIQLRKKALAQDLAARGLQEAFISFHSADAEISDAMTRAPGTHKHTVTGIKNTLEAGIAIYLNAVVERANYESLPEQAAFIVEHFVRPYRKNRPRLVTYSHPCHYYDQGEWKDALMPLDVVRPYVVEATRTLREAKIKIQVIGSCGFPPCLFKDAPELINWVRRDKFDNTDISGRVFPEICSGCAAKSRCMGVRSEYIQRYGERGLSPFKRIPKRFSWAIKRLFSPI